MEYIFILMIIIIIISGIGFLGGFKKDKGFAKTVVIALAAVIFCVVLILRYKARHKPEIPKDTVLEPMTIQDTAPKIPENLYPVKSLDIRDNEDKLIGTIMITDAKNSTIVVNLHEDLLGLDTGIEDKNVYVNYLDETSFK